MPFARQLDMETFERIEYRPVRTVSSHSDYSRFKLVVILFVATPTLYLINSHRANSFHEPLAALMIGELGLIGMIAWFGRRAYIEEVLKIRNERVVLDGEGLSHTNYKGVEDFRARYGEIVRIGPKEGPENRWVISTRERNLELSYHFEGIREILGQLRSALPPEAVDGFRK